MRVLTNTWMLAITAVFAAVSSADILSIDGMWHTQYQLMQASGETFATEYTATAAETVLITGYYENIDQYQVYLNGSRDLTTNAIGGAAAQGAGEFDARVGLQVVSEPASVAMVALGILGVALIRKRRRRD